MGGTKVHSKYIFTVMRGTILKSFTELQRDYTMPQTQFYRYLQFRHALLPSLKHLATLPEFSPLEAKVFMGDLHERKVSKIYQTLVTHCSSSLHKLKAAWEEDVGPLEDQDWTEAVAAPRGAAIAMRLRLIQFNYLHRVYFTRMRLWKAGLIDSQICLRCERAEGTLLHTVWTCLSLDRFWRGVFACLSEVLSWDLARSPKLALLHIMEGVGGNVHKRHLLLLGLTLAKRGIARAWKAQRAPPISAWKNGLDFCMGLEKPIFIARGCPRKHFSIWKRWADYRGLPLEPVEHDGMSP